MKELKVICKPVGTKAGTEVEDFLSGREIKLLEEEKWKGYFAVYQEVTVGILLYSVQEKYILLEHIFVKPGYRRHGIGKEMLERLCKFAKLSKKRLLFSFDATGNRDGFYRFVASVGNFMIERQMGFEACLTQKEVSDVGRQNTVKMDGIQLFFDQKKTVKEEFLKHLSKSYPAIAWELEHEPESYRKDLCCCVTDRGMIQAVSLIKKKGKELELKLMYGRPGKGTPTAKAMLGSFQLLTDGEILPMRISPVSESEVKILNFVCPQYEITKRFYVAYYLGI